MKLLLKNSIRSLGRAGEVVEVKAGYARNYLLPQGKAIPATSSNVALIDKYTARRADEEAQLKASYEEIQAQINGLEITLNLRANASNFLYGSFSAGDVVTQLNNRHVNIEKSMVQLEDSIKALGDYEIDILLSADIKAILKVSILNEDGELPDAEEEIQISPESDSQETDTEEAASEEAEVSTEVQEDNA
jgi:large subunit ribosomal protein L9